MDDATFLAGELPELTRLALLHRAGCGAAHLHTAFGEDGGYRTPAMQLRLWKRGRELTPTGWIITDPRKVATHALPAKAPHCRGAAYDLWLMFGHTGEDHLRRATMDPKDGWSAKEIETQTILWAAVVRIGTELGLVAGANWPHLKDFSHFELANWRDLPMKLA